MPPGEYIILIVLPGVAVVDELLAAIVRLRCGRCGNRGSGAGEALAASGTLEPKWLRTLSIDLVSLIQ